MLSNWQNPFAKSASAFYLGTNAIAHSLCVCVRLDLNEKSSFDCCSCTRTMYIQCACILYYIMVHVYMCVYATSISMHCTMYIHLQQQQAECLHQSISARYIIYEIGCF